MSSDLEPVFPIIASAIFEPFSLGGLNSWQSSPEYHPRRKKFKGYQRENRKYNSKLWK